MRYLGTPWSQCELDYLKKHRKKQSVNQLSGYLGKTRSAILRKMDELDGKDTPVQKGNRSMSKIGKRRDIQPPNKKIPGGIFLRSGWEANICRYLSWNKYYWEYEPCIFTFDGVKRGTTNYLPDFRVYLPDGSYIWIEVKGYLKRQDKTRIKRLKKYYPEEFNRLRFVAGSENTAAAKWFKEQGVEPFGYMTPMNKECKGKIDNWE